MATTSAPAQAAVDSTSLQEQAQRHLWMHFTRMGSFGPEHEVPIIVRGEGCYVWDDHGNRYLDGLSALFCVNSGHGRAELRDAMAAQVRELDFITVWSYAHPRAIELATRIAGLAPGDLNHVFFTNSGSEAVAAVILEPLQNAGGCIPPQDGYFQRVREICDRYDVLLVSDEVICAWGRLGHYFGCQRYGFQPDVMTVAKALTSANVPMGGMIVSDRVFEP